MGDDRMLDGVSVLTLGCKVNRTDSDAISDQVERLGGRLVQPEDAAVVIINSCTVTAEADAKCRKLISRLERMPHRPQVIVTGCMAAVADAVLPRATGRVIVSPERATAAALAVNHLAAGNASTAVAAVRPGLRHRVSVKVQDGCDARCSYCIVPDARGGPRSVPADEVTARVRELHERGVKEVVLTGINIGRYRWRGLGLASLLEQVTSTGVTRVRLSSVEPLDIDDALLATLASTPAVSPHLHIPLQSGSDAVLKTMNRRYRAADYARIIREARSALPGAAITTDVIAGHPGETDVDAEATVRLCEELGLARLHVFRYSQRPNTPAAAMPQVDPRVRDSRARSLRELDTRLRRSHALRRVGGRADVLIERADAETASGTTEDYLQATLAGDTDLAPGEMVTVEITGTTDSGGVIATRATTAGDGPR